MPINFPTEVDIWEIRLQILPLTKFRAPHEENMAAAKRARPEKGFFLGLERGERGRTIFLVVPSSSVGNASAVSLDSKIQTIPNKLHASDTRFTEYISKQYGNYMQNSLQTEQICHRNFPSKFYEFDTEMIRGSWTNHIYSYICHFQRWYLVWALLVQAAQNRARHSLISLYRWSTQTNYICHIFYSDIPLSLKLFW